MAPGVGADFGRGVRRVLEHIVQLVRLAVDHFLDFRADPDQRIAETVQLALILAFGGFHHDRIVHREGHRGRVEIIIHQALGDVFRLDAVSLEFRQVENHFMGDAPPGAGIEHLVIGAQSRRDVIGIEDGVTRCIAQACTAHQFDIGVGDEQDTGAAIGRGAHRRNRLAAADRDQGVARQERLEMRGDADGAHARTAAAVGNREGLVEIEMADVGANHRRIGQSHLGVHVGAVHIDLAAVFVDDVADFNDLFLKDAVGRWIGDHQAGEGILVRFGSGFQIGDVDVAVVVAGDHHDLHAGHDGAGGVGAMGRGGDERDGALQIAARTMPGADDHESGEFALGAGIGLERCGGETGDLAQILLQFRDHFEVARRLILRCEGMQPAETGPAQRQHLRRAVQFHGAGSQRNHGGGEGEVLLFQTFQIAHYFVFGAVFAEDRMRHESRGALQGAADDGARLRVPCDRVLFHTFGVREERDDFIDVPRLHRLVQGDGEVLDIDGAEVDAAGQGRFADFFHFRLAGLNFQRIEKRCIELPVAESFQRGGEHARQVMDAAGDVLQALRAVPDAVHPRHDGQERLGGADVGGGFFAADVLFTRLQGHAIGFFTMAVDRDADDAAGHLANVFGAGGEEGGVGAAESHGHAETLRTSQDDVGAHLPRGRQQHQREQIGGHSHQGAFGVRLLDEGARILHIAVDIRVLDEDAEDAIVDDGFGKIRNAHLNVVGCGAGLEHIDGLRQAFVRDEKEIVLRIARLFAVEAVDHAHGLGGGSRLVKQRGIGDRHAGEVADHMLEDQQGFEAPLGDFRLIGRVLGVPAGIFKDIAQDDGRGDGVVKAQSDIGTEHPVPGRQFLQVLQQLIFADRGLLIEGFFETDAGGDGLVDERVQGVYADLRQHIAFFGFIRPDMTEGESVRCGEIVFHADLIN